MHVLLVSITNLRKNICILIQIQPNQDTKIFLKRLQHSSLYMIISILI